MYKYGLLFSIVLAATAYHKEEYGKADIQKYAAVCNDLGYRLQREESYQPGNQAMSPYGISAMLGALYQGAEGKTEHQIGQIGYKELEQQGCDITEVHHKLSRALQQSSEESDLEEATAMVCPSHYSLSSQYRDMLESSYEALIQKMDRSEGNGQTAQKVNRWVQKQTDGKMSHIVRNIDASSGMVWLNAVYFHGELQTQYDKREFQRRPFYNEDGSKSQSVAYYQTQSHYPYYEDHQMQAVQLPFEDEDYTLLVILPNEKDDVKQLQQEVNYRTIQKIIDNSEKTQVTVTIPQFKMDYSQKLLQNMRSLGITSPFGRESEWSDINTERDAYVSEMAHRCVMKFGQSIASNEDYGNRYSSSEEDSGSSEEDSGSSDSSSEEDYGNRYSSSEKYYGNRYSSREQDYKRRYSSHGQVEFEANHPFLFYVIHEETGLNLIAGRVCQMH